MKRFLITTAFENTWRDDTPILFLGEWCRLFSHKERWKAMDAEVLPYHWDDRQKFDNDYQYLCEFYERLLGPLAHQLNLIHHVDHDHRYWRILIGPWLAYFTQILFDRWCSIQSAVKVYDLSETIVITGNEDAMVPTDMAHLDRLMESDEWNHHIYSVILRRFTTVSIVEYVQVVSSSGEYTQGLSSANKVSAQAGRRARTLKSFLAAWYEKFASAFVRENDAFIIRTYLPSLKEMRLHYRFGQIPQRWRSLEPPRLPVEWRQREWLLSVEGRSDFEKCALALLPNQIPTAYVEGYEHLVDQIKDLPWPKNPKLIFTAGVLWHDSVSMAYIAEKVEEGTRLAYGQHGGVYGTAKFTWAERHETAIADSYITWGWVDDSRPNITPIGMLKGIYPFSRVNAKANLLLVLVSQNRYSARLDSDLKSSQLLAHINNLFEFADKLPGSIKDRLLVRLYMHEYGWQHSMRWQERCPGVRVDAGRSTMNDLLRDTRLAVYTYNSTGYLEAFASGVPALIFWDPAAYPLRSEATPFFEELKHVGLFHETAESAANHIAAIWDDVDGWWSTPPVQSALSRFTKQYCRLPEDLLDDLETSLRRMAADGNAETGTNS